MSNIKPFIQRLIAIGISLSFFMVPNQAFPSITKNTAPNVFTPKSATQKSQKNITTITSNTACRPMKWRTVGKSRTKAQPTPNQAMNACLCCIIKHAPRDLGALTLEKAGEISTHCKEKKGYCNNDIMDTIRTTYNIEIRKGIQNNAAIIQEIVKSNVALQFVNIEKQFLDKSGDLTIDGVQQLMKQLQYSTDTTDALKARIHGATFKVTNLGKAEGGAQTLQLFMIDVVKQGNEVDHFILKGMKKPFEEVENLQIVKQSPLVKYFITPGQTSHQPADQPAIASDELNIVYATPSGGERYISLINMASGQAIKKIINSYIQNPNKENIDVANEALFALGKAIAIIHRDNQRSTDKSIVDKAIKSIHRQNQYTKEKSIASKAVTTIHRQNDKSIMGKTIVHGDFHPENAFYDPKTKRVTIIDNESFALSIPPYHQKLDPAVDIMKFYGTLVASFNPSHNYLQKAKQSQKQGEALLHLDIIQPFVEGYLSIFTGDEKKEAYNKLQKIMTSQGTIKSFLQNDKTILNPVKLTLSQKQYMPMVFDNIKKKLNMPSGNPAPSGPQPSGKSSSLPPHRPKTPLAIKG